ncbi:MAG: hypothetical protein EOP82_23335, partial [Variovorax sp.]
MTCDAYPREISEQRGRYEDQPTTQGSDARSEQFARIGGASKPHVTDSEVVPRARRRQFSNAEKRRIVEAADRCTKPGEIGALMRREGVY